MSCAAGNPTRHSLPLENGLGLARTEQSIQEKFDDAPNGTGLDRNPEATQHSHHDELHGRGCQIGPDAVALQNMRTPAERVPRYGTGPFGESDPSLAPNLQARDIRGIECMAVSDENASGQQVGFDRQDALPSHDLLLKSAEEGLIVPAFRKLEPQTRWGAMDDVGSALIVPHEEGTYWKAVSSMPGARDILMTACT